MTPVNGAGDLGVAEIELGGFQSGFGLLDDWTVVARLVVG